MLLLMHQAGAGLCQCLQASPKPVPAGHVAVQPRTVVQNASGVRLRAIMKAVRWAATACSALTTDPAATDAAKLATGPREAAAFDEVVTATAAKVTLEAQPDHKACKAAAAAADPSAAPAACPMQARAKLRKRSMQEEAEADEPEQKRARVNTAAVPTTEAAVIGNKAQEGQAAVEKQYGGAEADKQLCPDQVNWLQQQIGVVCCGLPICRVS